MSKIYKGNKVIPVMYISRTNKGLLKYMSFQDSSGKIVEDEKGVPVKWKEI